MLAGFLLQTGIEFDAVFQHFCDVDGGTKLPDQAGRMEGGAAREFSLVHNDNVLPPHLRQMVGDTAARDPSPDDDNPCLIFHRRSPSTPVMES